MNNEEIIKLFWKKYPNIDKKMIKDYVNFCLDNKCDLYIKGKTAKHHILPMAKDCFPEYKSLKENKWNEVILLHKNHYIAHSKLALMGIRSQVYAWYAMNNKDTKVNKISNPELILGAEKYNKLMILRENEIHKPLSLEARQKISKARKLNPHYESYSGENNGMYGKHLSQESKNKISLSSKKYWNSMTTEEYNKIRKERSKRMSGENNPMFGHKYSKEEKNKISAGVKKWLSTLTDEQKLEIKKKKKPMIGANNPMSKNLKVSYGNEIFYVNGTLQNFCLEHNLSYSGMLKILSGWKPTKRSKCYGWTIEEII